MIDCEQLIDSYLKWIKNNTVVRSIKEGDVCAISTPFLDRHNDHLEIYLSRDNGHFRLTDDGFTISDLKMSGLDINTPKREGILRTTLNGFGVKLGDHDNLYVEASQSNLGQKKHYLIQAILAVNDMFNLAQENIYSLFKEDVELYFRSNDIVFSKDIKLTGKSGFDHNIDFLIPRSKTKPERLIKAVNNPKKDAVLASIMAFTDIREARENPTKDLVVYNDADKTVSADVVLAMSNYGIEAVPWTHREEHLSDFSLN